MTVLKNLANTCEFGALKESLIHDRIVFGIQDSSVREQLLRDAKLTLETAIEKVRSAELTQIQLKQMKADKATDESVSAINTDKPPEKLPSKFPMIDCKFYGKRHMVQSARSVVLQTILQKRGEQRKQDIQKQANDSTW